MAPFLQKNFGLKLFSSYYYDKFDLLFVNEFNLFYFWYRYSGTIWSQYPIWALLNLRILNTGYLCRIWLARDLDGKLNQSARYTSMLDSKIQSTKVLTSELKTYELDNLNTVYLIRISALWTLSTEADLFPSMDSEFRPMRVISFNGAQNFKIFRLIIGCWIIIIFRLTKRKDQAFVSISPNRLQK